MKIKILDRVIENYDLSIDKEYDVIRTEVKNEDLYYIVLSDNGEEFGVIDVLIKVL
jgi:hypothetical protein